MNKTNPKNTYVNQDPLQLRYGPYLGNQEEEKRYMRARSVLD